MLCHKNHVRYDIFFRYTLKNKTLVIFQKKMTNVNPRVIKTQNKSLFCFIQNKKEPKIKLVILFYMDSF